MRWTKRSGLPEFARHGLFAKPQQLDVWVRLSNGGLDRARKVVYFESQKGRGAA